MRFALLGEHPDGLAMALALCGTKRHELVAYSGSPGGAERLRARGVNVPARSDMEAVLAKAAVEAVIVAVPLARRPQALRRAAQSEKHVLCVHPADVQPDITYEISMIAQDTKKVMLPLLVARFSPALARLRDLAGTVVGKLDLIELEHPIPPGIAEDAWDQSPLVFIWDPLRFLAGDMADVSAVASGKDVLRPVDSVTLTGRFQSGCLYRVLLAPSPEPRCRLAVKGDRGQAELVFPGGLNGPAALRVDPAGASEEIWQSADLWRSLVNHFEAAVAGPADRLTWLDGTRCLELFDAARQSVRRQRVIPMEYEAMTEAGNFKTVMTAMGCGVLFLVVAILIVLLIAGVPLAPWVLAVIVPLLGLFLLLQMLRWIVPEERPR